MEGDGGDHVYTAAQEVTMETASGTIMLPHQEQGTTVYLDGANLKEDVIIRQGEEEVVYIVQSKVVEMPDGSYAIIEEEGDQVAVTDQGAAYQVLAEMTEEICDGSHPATSQTTIYMQGEPAVASTSHGTPGSGVESAVESVPKSSIVLAAAESVPTSSIVLAGTESVPTSSIVLTAALSGLDNHMDGLDGEMGETEVKFVLCCQYCGTCFEDVDELKAHLQEEHDHVEADEDDPDVAEEELECDTMTVFPTCNICQETYLDEADLKSHIQQCVGSTKVTSVEQTQIGDSKMAVKKEKQVLIHKCQMCDMAFTVRSELDKHIEDGVHTFREDTRDQTEKLPYVKCPYCERLFLEKWLKKSLYRHIKIEHPGLSSEVPIQRVVVENISQIKSPRVNSKQNNFPCGLCDKIFIWKKSLLRHVKTFHEEVQYMSAVEVAETFGFYWGKRRKRSRQSKQCFFCESVFQNSQERDQHMAASHTREEFDVAKSLYKCPCCSLISKYNFCIRKHILLKHPSAYTEEEVANLVLPTVDPVMYADAVKVLDKRPYDEKYKECLVKYQCPFCEYVSTNVSNMYRHIRSKRHENVYTDDLLKDIEKLKVVQKKDTQEAVRAVASQTTELGWRNSEIAENKPMEDEKISTTTIGTAVNVNKEVFLNESISEDGNKEGCQVDSEDVMREETDAFNDLLEANDSCDIDDEESEAVLRECVVCQKSFTSLTQIVEHSRRHVNMRLNYRCPSCEKTCPRLDMLVKHQSSKHNVTIKGAAIRYLQMDSVQSNEKPVTTFDCPYCELVVSKDRILQQHIMQAHGSLVNKIYIKQESLDGTSIDPRLHSNQSLVAGFPCLYCLCVYNTVTGIVKHMTLVHSDTDRGQGLRAGGSVRKSSRKRKAKDFGEDFESEVTPVKYGNSVGDNDEGRSASPLLLLPTLTRKRRKKESKVVDADNCEVSSPAVGDDVSVQAEDTTVGEKSTVLQEDDDSSGASGKKSETSDNVSKENAKPGHLIKTGGRKRKMVAKKLSEDASLKGVTETSEKSEIVGEQSTPVEARTSIVRKKKKNKVETPALDVIDVSAVNKCPHCDFTCKRASALTFHMNFNHSNIKKEVIDPEYDDVHVTQMVAAEQAKILDTAPDVDDDNYAEYVPDASEEDKDNTEYECPFCDQCKSNKAVTVEKHVERMHRQEVKSLSNVVQKRKIVAGSTEEQVVLICFYCRQQFTSKNEIEKHILEKHQHRPMKTGKKRKHSPEADLVVGQQERPCFSCPHCECLFTSTVGVLWHVNLKHPDDEPVQEADIQIVTSEPGAKFISLYSCPYCENCNNKQRKAVLRHVRATHKDTLDSFSVDDVPCEMIESKKQVNQSIDSVLTDVVNVLDENVNIEEITKETNDSVLFGGIAIENHQGEGVENRYVCPYCDFSSTWKKSIVKHVKGLHPEMAAGFHGDMVVCETVAKKTKVPEIGYFTCPYCNAINKWKKSLIRHLRQNHPELPQVVNFTASMSGEEQSNLDHSDVLAFKDKIKKVLRCLLCAFSCRTKAALISHFNQTHPEVSELGTSHYECTYDVPNDKKAANCHKCPKCDARYLWQKSIYQHMKVQHPEEHEIYTLLDRLVKIVHTQESGSGQRQGYRCPQCILVLPCRTSLRNHLRLRHSQDRKRVHAKIPGRRCTLCTMYYPTSAALLRHRALSHNTKAVRCGHCGRGFQTWRECQIHEKVRHPTETHLCPYPGCDVRLSFKMLLSNHMKTHQVESEGLLKCEVCGDMFQEKGDLKHHLLSVHASCDLRLLGHRRARVFRCSRCQKTFQSLIQRDFHMEEVHKDSTFMCELCAAQFPAARLLKLHMRSHGPTTKRLQRVICSHCGKSLYSKNLKKHMYFRHPHTMSCTCDICSAPYDGSHSIACRTCSRQFCSKIMLYGHNRIHHGMSGPLYSSKTNAQTLAKHQCLFCPSQFRTQRDRNIHMHESHRAERQKASKELYSSTTAADQLVAADGSDLDNTHVIHVGQTQGKQYLPKLSDTSFGAVIKELVYVMPKNSALPYKCLLCGRCFAKSKYIRLHIRRAHVKDEDQPYRCKVCGSGFVRLTEFRKHSRAHSGFRPYKCNKCSKAFKQQSNLREHMYVHEDTKGFKCVICSRDFRQRGALNAHVNCHDTLKPFKCMFCKKGFTSRGELSRHMQRYDPEDARNGERNFLCHICEQTFNHYPLLLKHIEEHNPEKPFECIICSQRFNSFMSLYSHKLKYDHFVESDIETNSVEWNGKRGRRPKKLHNVGDVEKAVSSLNNGDTQIYDMTTGDNILINQPEESYIMEDTMQTSIEVVVDGLGDAEMLYVTEENAVKSETEELLSIAKQLTELSSYTEETTGMAPILDDGQSAETAQMLKAEDEIIKDMLDADAVLLANMDRQSAGRKWLYDVSYEVEKTPLLRETLLNITTPSALTEVSEADNAKEVVEAAANIDDVVSSADGTQVDTITDQLPSNLDELTAMIPSMVQNEKVTAYQSEDGTMIFLCVSEQPFEETVESETIVEESEQAQDNDKPDGVIDADHNDNVGAISNGVIDVYPETVIERQNGEETEVTIISEHPQNTDAHDQVESAEVVEQTEEQIISIAALDADTAKILDNATGSMVGQINVEIIEQNEVAEVKDETFEESVVEYENDEQTFIQEEVLDENFAKSLNECNVYTYQGQEFRYRYLLDQKRFQCLECNFLVTSPKYLKLHMTRHLSMENRRCACHLCEKRFVTNSELRRHMTTHTDERNYKCHVCTKAFRQVGHLNDHVKTHTREKLFKCSDCDAEFITKSNMEIHWKRNHDANRETFRCEHCGADFLNKDGLKKHVGIQHSALFEDGSTRKSKDSTGAKYVCETCGLTFRSQTYLSRHMRKHGNFEAVCDVCGAGFMRADTLKDHVAKMHTKEKTHMCEYCGQAFSVAQQLNAHHLKHKKATVTETPKQKWECKVCGKQFGAKSSLAYHGGVSEACRSGLVQETADNT